MGIITDILKEIPLSAVLREKIINLETKMSVLEAENATLKTENLTLKNENSDLKALIENLRQEIQRRDDVIQKEKSQGSSFDDIHIKILSYLLLSNDREYSSDNISRSLKLNPQTVKLHIEELKLRKMIKFKRFPSSLYISEEGKQYLIKNKLIS